MAGERRTTRNTRSKSATAPVVSDYGRLQPQAPELEAMIFVPAYAGILCANYVIRDIIGEV